MSKKLKLGNVSAYWEITGKWNSQTIIYIIYTFFLRESKNI